MPGPGFLEHLHPPRLQPERVKITHSWCLGGLAFAMFLVLAASGLLLMLAYTPTTPGAAVFFSQESGGIPFLWLFRRLHFWSGQAMCLLVLAHMARVIIHKAFLPPRAANWLVGLALLLFTFLLDFTGYALRWDPAMQSALTVAASLVEEVPVLGGLAKRIFLGGDRVAEPALLRLYVLHCLILPALAGFFTMYHFWRIRKDGRPTSGL